MKRLYLCLAGCAAAFAAAAAGPTDNLRADWRNPVQMYRPGATSSMVPAVQLGLGSGVYWTTNRYMYNALGSYTRYTTASSLANATKP